MIKINLGKSEPIIVDDFYRRVVLHQNNPKKLIEDEICKDEILVKLLKDLVKAIDGTLLKETDSIIIAKHTELINYIKYFDINYYEIFNDLINLKNFKSEKNKINKKIKDKKTNPNIIRELKLKVEKLEAKITQIEYVDKFFKKTFYYKSYDKWDAYQLAHNLYNLGNIKVCPYCNRNFITVLVDEDNGGQTRMIFDHYYDKATYPYLALSFYNLIPSCKVCNSDFKNIKNFHKVPHIHPYEDDFINLHFKLDIENIEFVNTKIGSYNIKLNVEDFKNDCYTLNKILNHNNTFKLEKLANFHKSITDRIIRKFYVYNEEKIDELYNSFDGKLFSSKEEVLLMIYGKLSIDNTEPFSKLTLDIVDDLNGKKYFFDGIVAENE